MSDADKEKMTWGEFTRLPFADKMDHADIIPGRLYRISGKSYCVLRAVDVKIDFGDHEADDDNGR